MSRGEGGVRCRVVLSMCSGLCSLFFLFVFCAFSSISLPYFSFFSPLPLIYPIPTLNTIKQRQLTFQPSDSASIILASDVLGYSVLFLENADAYLEKEMYEDAKVICDLRGEMLQ
ncbi:hypothetical protein BJ165DRAFT_335636 [Panaeolus papilionaceus]|nr:hypothetical protein BJ165DRAFT_335636 [Panaeolus papilionaceus]